MGNFKYKTKNNSTPNGKPKVYYCYHQKDLIYQLNKTSLELFKYLNINIIYLEGECDDINNNFEMISTCKLIILPIICDVFAEDDIEYKELKYAMKHNIPILPLLIVQNMEEAYSKKVGDFQYIKFTEDALYEIGMKGQIEKKLTSIFTDDETVNKIREAFSGYMFLSYRKKDKKYVEQLMRLIHNIPECQNIAIWYDEFLTPGENFNEKIESMILESDFFVLVVTPNLVNEINYVMSIEYPLAYQNEKDIIPIELVETDREDLEKKYYNIAPCISTKGNEMQIAFSNNEKIKKISKEPYSLEKQYLIGVAYLEGIDVEVNKSLARKMIEMSAEAGYEPAMKKLVNIYRYGDGVDKNVEEAILWLRKIINHINEEENLNEERVWDLLEARIDLIDIQHEENISKDEYFYEIVEDAIKWLSNSSKLYSSYLLVDILHTYILGYYNIGLSGYNNYHYKALEVVEKVLINHPNDRYSLEMYAKCYYVIALINRDKELKKENFLKSISILEKLEEDEHSTIYLSLSKSYFKLCEISLRDGLIREAIQFFEKAEYYIFLDGNDYEISDLYCDFASDLYFVGEYEYALENLTKALSLIPNNHSDSQDYLKLKKHIYVYYYRTYLKMHKYDLSCEYEEKTISLLKELCKINSRLYKFDLKEFVNECISDYEKLGNYNKIIEYKLMLLNIDFKVSLMVDLINAYLKLSDLKNAKVWVKKTEDELDNNKNMNLQYSEIRGLKYEEMRKNYLSAKIYILEGNLRKAFELLIKCVVFNVRFREKYSADMNLIEEISKILKQENKVHVMNMFKYIFSDTFEFSLEYDIEDYCDVFKELNEEENKKICKYGFNTIIELLTKDLNKIQQNKGDNENKVVIWDISAYLLAIGFCYDKIGKTDKAYEYYKQSFEIEEPFIYFNQRIKNYCSLGHLCEKNNDNVKAEIYYNKAEVIAKDNYNYNEQIEKDEISEKFCGHIELYAKTLLKKGDFLEKNNIGLAIKIYLKGYELLNSCDTYSQSVMANCLLRIGNCYLKNQDYETAIGFLEKIDEINVMNLREKDIANYLLLNAFVNLNNKEKSEYYYRKNTYCINQRFKIRKYIKDEECLNIHEYKELLMGLKIRCDIFYTISENDPDFKDETLFTYLNDLLFFKFNKYEGILLYNLYLESILIKIRPTIKIFKILYTLYMRLFLYYFEQLNEELFIKIVFKFIWLYEDYRLKIKEKIELREDEKKFYLEIYLASVNLCEEDLREKYLNEAYRFSCELYEETKDEKYLDKIKTIEKMLSNNKII